MNKKFTQSKWPGRAFLSALVIFSSWLTPAKAQVDVTATAGTATASYPTLNAAFTAINGGTHQGTISILITANTTEPAASSPLVRSGSGAASYTSISIMPSGGDWTINSAAAPTASRGMIELFGADNVTIDGDDPMTAGSRNLTFGMATSTASNIAAIRLASTSTTGTDGANNNTIRNCNIIGSRSSSSTTTTSYGIVMSTSTDITTGAYSSLNTVIENNRITRCYEAIYASGASTTYPNTGTQILNNIIGTDAAGYTDATSIGHYGVYLNYASTSTSGGSPIVRGNDIRGGSATSYSGLVCGISLVNSCYGALIEKNNIHDLNQPSSGGYGPIGIYIPNAHDAVNIRNNFITRLRGYTYSTSATGVWNTYGIYISGAVTNLSIDYNTIALNVPIAGSSSNTGSGCITITTSGAAISSLRNNILVNTLSSTQAYGLYCTANANISAGAIDYNDYYVPGGNVGYYNGAARTTLAAWQSATSKDANSYSVSPAFVSATDLHIDPSLPTANLLDGKGVTIAGITTDFDNDTRNASTPDIGADEFTIPVCTGATGGTAAPATVAVCAGQTVALNVTGASIGTGTSYQWEVSTTSGSGFANVTGGTGATTASYTTGALTTGVYYYRLNVGCAPTSSTALSNEVVVTVNALPTIGITPASPQRCATDVTPTALTASGASTYTWSPASGLSATTGGSVNATSTITTTYTATGTDVNGCVGTGTVTVTVFQTPSAPVVTPAAPAICSGGNIVLNASSTYPVPTSAVLGSGSSISALATTTATTFPNPFSNYYGGNKHQMLIRASELTSLGMVSGSVISSIGLPVSTVNVSGVGLLSFLVRAGHTPLAALTTFQTGLTDVTTAATFTPGPGVNTITFSTPFTWNGIDNIIIETSYSNDNTGTSGGNVSMVYGSTPFASTLVYRDDNIDAPVMNNHTGTVSFTLSARPNITFGYSNPTPVAGANIQWSPAMGLSATTGASVTASPSATSTYNVTAVNGLCTSAASSVTVSVGDPLVCGSITAPSGTICAGTNFSLSSNATGSGTLTYAWSDGLGTVYPNAASITANLPAGTHTISLTVSDGCGANCTTSQIVTIDPTPTASISGVSSPVCQGTPLNFTGNTDVGTSFTWTGPNSFSSTVQNPSVASPGLTASGTYTFTSTLGSCTSAPATFSLIVNPSPTLVTATPSDASLCTGETVDLTSTANNYGILLSENFNSTPAGWTTVNNTTGGTPANAAWTLRSSPYAIWLTNISSNDNSQFYLTNGDAAGSGSVTKTILTSPVFSTVGFTSVSLNYFHYYKDYASTTTDSAKVEISTNGTTWTTLQTFVGGDAGTPAAFANPVLDLTAYTGNPTVYVRFRYVGNFAYGWAVDNVTVTGSPSPYTFSWTSTPAGFTSTDQNPTGVAPTATTDYTVTATNTYNCSLSATTTVTVNALPTVTASSDEVDNTICDGDDVVLTGSGADSYTWDNGATDGAATVPAGTTTYTVTGTVTATGCTDTDVITINVDALPIVGATSTAPGDSICAGGTLTLNGTGTDSYVWDNGVTDNVAFNATTTTTYTVTGTETATGCENTATITIDVNTLPAVTAGSDDADNTICEGSNITLNGGGADSYTWDNGAADGVAFAPTATTTYTVTGTDLNGCENTATITITVNTVDVGTTTSLSTITANSATGTYQWIDCATMTPIAGETNQSFTATVDGDYAVIVTDNGCTETSACVNITGTGIHNLAGITFGLYPNPTSGAFTIVSGIDAQVTILDMLGNVVMNGKLNKGNNQFNMGELARGVYIIRIANNNGQHLNTQRVTIQK